MKKYYLLFVFVFTSGFLMAQFSITITQKDGSSRTITKTEDTAFNTIYTEEFTDKDGRIYQKAIWKKDLLGRWESTNLEKNPKNKAEFIVITLMRMNEKGEMTAFEDNVLGTIDDFSNINRKSELAHRIRLFNWFDNLKKDTQPPPAPERNDGSSKKKVDKKCEEKKVSIYIGPSLLNVDNGSSRESFFGGQVYGLVSINSKIGIGADFSLNSKKNGDQKFTRSLILARGQYDFFTGDKCDKGVIPEAHILIGLGSESFKYTYDGNTSESSQSGFAYGVGAGVGINISPNINLGISLDYIGINSENSDSANSNIRASAGIKIGLGNGKKKELGLCCEKVGWLTCEGCVPGMRSRDACKALNRLPGYDFKAFLKASDLSCTKL